MIKKAIFGGTFNPIHNGHLYIAYEALYTLDLDEVIFMPSGIPPHKRNANILESSIRYSLVKEAIKTEDKFTVSDYEINKGGISYTYETLEHFKSELKEDDILYFITGTDCLVELNTWKHVDKILENCELVVFNRPIYSEETVLESKTKIENEYNKGITFLNTLNLEISSSYIRECIKDDKKVYYFLPESVSKYIEENKLYK